MLCLTIHSQARHPPLDLPSAIDTLRLQLGNHTGLGSDDITVIWRKINPEHGESAVLGGLAMLLESPALQPSAARIVMAELLSSKDLDRSQQNALLEAAATGIAALSELAPENIFIQFQPSLPDTDFKPRTVVALP